MVDLRKIKKLIELLEESALTELEIQEGDESIRLRRAQTSEGLDLIANTSPAKRATSIDVSTATPVASDGGHTIFSPMVGTFYAAPEAGAPPYVELGTTVNPGDTLCIIEAMKIFNHVESERHGRISKIFKESGDPVEFGEALFLIDESPTTAPDP